MKNIFLVINIILSILIIFFILLQGKGAGLGNSWVGGGEFFQTRVGIEKITFRITIFLIVLFLIFSFVNLIYR